MCIRTIVMCVANIAIFIWSIVLRCKLMKFSPYWSAIKTATLMKLKSLASLLQSGVDTCGKMQSLYCRIKIMCTQWVCVLHLCLKQRWTKGAHEDSFSTGINSYSTQQCLVWWSLWQTHCKAQCCWAARKLVSHCWSHYCIIFLIWRSSTPVFC